MGRGKEYLHFYDGGLASSMSSLERLIGNQERLCRGQPQLVRCHFKLECVQMVSLKTYSPLIYRCTAGWHHGSDWHLVHIQHEVVRLSLSAADVLPQEFPTSTHLG